jgi:hypothetical protein
LPAPVAPSKKREPALEQKASGLKPWPLPLDLSVAPYLDAKSLACWAMTCGRGREDAAQEILSLDERFSQLLGTDPQGLLPYVFSYQMMDMMGQAADQACRDYDREVERRTRLNTPFLNLFCNTRPARCLGLCSGIGLSLGMTYSVDYIETDDAGAAVTGIVAFCLLTPIATSILFGLGQASLVRARNALELRGLPALGERPPTAEEQRLPLFERVRGISDEPMARLEALSYLEVWRARANAEGGAAIVQPPVIPEEEV